MVLRGERWKYVNANYDKIFNIKEIKDPQISIDGDIWSNYNTERLTNEYTAYLRWSIQLSDLNENGNTRVHIYRDSVEIADIIFSKAEYIGLKEGISSGDEGVIAVKVTVNGESNSFTGDFNFLTEDQMGVPYWSKIYMKQDQNVLYFDAHSHRRLSTFDSDQSWFVLTDKFESPRLDETDFIPSSYTYWGKMEGYTYEILENNPNLITGVDGLLYHSTTYSPEYFQSQPTVLYTSMALPSIDFDGLYTFQQIVEDTDGLLSETVPFIDRYNKDVTFNFTIDPGLLAQLGSTDGGVHKQRIIQNISLVDVTERSNPMIIKEYSLPNFNGVYSIVFKGLEAEVIQQGHSYQVIQHSNFRGSFGSPIITIPEVPNLTSDLQSIRTQGVEGHHHSDAVYRSSLTFVPIMQEGDSVLNLIESDYEVGIWRTLSTLQNSSSPYYAMSELGNEDLVYHIGGNIENSSATSCTECSEINGLTPISEDNPEFNYSESYDVPIGTTHTLGYRVRVYVKVPSRIIGGEDRWMITQSNSQVNYVTPAGISNPIQDSGFEEYVKFYDIQGREVGQPNNNKCYIRKSNIGTKIVIDRM